MANDFVTDDFEPKQANNTVKKHVPRVILASGSPRRLELLKQVIPNFEVASPDVIELEEPEIPPDRLAMANAFNKAMAVATRIPDALVIGADTVVELNGQIYGKPKDIYHAKTMLMELRGKTHRVITGVALVWIEVGVTRTFAEVSHVTFKQFSNADLEQYLARVNVLDKAGAYAIQETPELIIQSYTGSWSNIVGLPIERVAEELSKIPNFAQYFPKPREV
jgi:septum formation protein